MDCEDLLNAVKIGLESIDHDVKKLTYVGPVAGGIVNQAALYETGTKNYFVKWNTKPCTQDMFETESESLKLLDRLDLFHIPESFVVCKDHTGIGALHILEYIENLKPLEKWSEFGTLVGTMHTYNSRALQRDKDQKNITSESCDIAAVHKFGFHVPTYLGNFTPGVVWRDTWSEYFVRDILNGLFTQAESKYSDREIRESWSELQLNVEKVFKDENIQPELLHGDFCQVNFGQAGDKAVLFDPSCLYGDPDFELIMSVTETPFNESFFTTYRKLRPMSADYENKMAAYRLFYYLIMWCHVDNEDFRTNTLKSINELSSIIKEIK